MVKLLKLFGKGILVTILLPFIILAWVLYGIYCFVAFIVMFFVNVVEFFQGKNTNGDLIEDLEARKMILEKEKADEQTKQMVNIMYQNAMAQAALNQQLNNQSSQNPAPTVQPYGIDNFAEQPEPVQEEQSPSLEDGAENNDDFDAR